MEVIGGGLFKSLVGVKAKLYNNEANNELKKLDGQVDFSSWSAKYGFIDL